MGSMLFPGRRKTVHINRHMDVSFARFCVAHRKSTPDGAGPWTPVPSKTSQHIYVAKGFFSRTGLKHSPPLSLIGCAAKLALPRRAMTGVLYGCFGSDFGLRG